MKAIDEYFPVVLFVLPYNVVLTFEPVDETLKCDHPNGSIEQYFPVVLFFWLVYSVALTCEPVDESQEHDISVESQCAATSISIAITIAFLCIMF